MTVVGALKLELIEDIAAELHLAPATLRKRVRACRFPHVKYPDTKRALLPRDWVEAFKAGNVELETKPLAGGGRICRPKGLK